jgi:hypothetical protein
MLIHGFVIVTMGAALLGAVDGLDQIHGPQTGESSLRMNGNDFKSSSTNLRLRKQGE